MWLLTAQIVALQLLGKLGHGEGPAINKQADAAVAPSKAQGNHSKGGRQKSVLRLAPQHDCWRQAEQRKRPSAKKRSHRQARVPAVGSAVRQESSHRCAPKSGAKRQTGASACCGRHLAGGAQAIAVPSRPWATAVSAPPRPLQSCCCWRCRYCTGSAPHSVSWCTPRCLVAPALRIRACSSSAEHCCGGCSGGA